MEYADLLRKIMFLNPIPWDGGQVPKTIFAGNYMKCADLHRKAFLTSPHWDEIICINVHINKKVMFLNLHSMKVPKNVLLGTECNIQISTEKLCLEPPSPRGQKIYQKSFARVGELPKYLLIGIS